MAVRIDLSTFATRRAAGELVIDVRETDEYVAGHVPGAVSVPLSSLPAGGSSVPTGSPLLVICRSGARSQRGADVFTSLGYDAVSVDGGTMAWIEAGNPVVTGPEAC